MVYALLRAQPAAAPREDYAPTPSALVWEILLSHRIPSEGYFRKAERRGSILHGAKSEWLELFGPVMHGVATLLWQISQHICPEYALWEGDLEPDHLHEAVQRLILQYLVEHQDDPIELDPGHLRPAYGRIGRRDPAPVKAGHVGLCGQAAHIQPGRIRGGAVRQRRAGGRPLPAPARVDRCRLVCDPDRSG